MRLASLPLDDPRHRCIQGACNDHAGPMEATAGTRVRLTGVIWGRTYAGTAIIQLPSGALAAVPLEDIEAIGG